MTNADKPATPAYGFGQVLRGAPQPTHERSSPERLAELHGIREWLKDQRGWWLLAVVLASAAAEGVMLWSRAPVSWTLGLLGVAVLLALWLLYYFSPSSVDDEIHMLEVEVQITGQPAAQADAYRLFKLHQLELEKYYRHTLRNSQVLMWVGLTCLAVGLCIVLFAANEVLSNRSSTSQGDWLVAALGAVGGILANYVAAMYLKMHAAASQALNDFHNRLVSTHHLHFGNYLASRINTPATLEKTLETMAEELARR